MEPKIKLSHIIKYVLLGSILISSLIFYFLYMHPNIIAYPSAELEKIIDLGKSFSFITMFALLALSYMTGLFIITANELLVSIYQDLFYIPTTNNKKSNLNKIICWILKNFFFYGTIDNVCREHKKYAKKNNNIPWWVVLSSKPAKNLFIISEKVSSESGQGNKSEYLYFNEFILGLRFIIYILVLFFVGVIVCDPNYITSDKWAEILIGILILFLSVFILSRFAIFFSRKYIEHIDSCIEAYDIDISKIISKNGLPCAYVLVSTATNRYRKFLKNAIESVISQDYGNIKLVILEDTDNVINTSRTKKRIKELVKTKNNIELIYYCDNYGGSAAATLALKRRFAYSASKEDVAILLEDDSEFAVTNAITSIVLRLTSTGSDMCLVGYNKTDAIKYSLTDAKHEMKYNALLEEYSEHDKSYLFNSNMHAASSVKWTKCYNHSLINKYITLIEECDKYRKKKCLERYKSIKFDKKNKKRVFVLSYTPRNIHSKYIDSRYLPFGAFKNYSGFPDYICFLFKDVKITAIKGALYNYISYNNSRLSKQSKESFQINRNFYLHYLEDCVRVAESTTNTKIESNNEVKNETNRYIKFKLSIIIGILEKRIKNKEIIGYDVKDFLTDYVKYGNIGKHLKEEEDIVSKLHNDLKNISDN